jgi:serine phosphatase RsbU (regulator of sigma subunit)
MRRASFLTILLLLLFSSAVPAQDKERLHMALEKLKTQPEDTVRVLLLNNVGWDTSYDNLAVGLAYCLESLRLAEELNYDKGIIVASNSLGTIYEDMGDFKKAIDYHLRSLTMGEKQNNRGAMATTHMNIALVYGGMEQRAKQLDHLLKADSLSRLLNDYDALTVVNSNLGSCYLHLDSVERAKTCFLKAMEYAEKEHSPISVAHALSGLARCYHAGGDSAKADFLMRRSLEIMDSVRNDYEYSQEQFQYAEMLAERGSFSKAEKLLADALSKFRKIGMVQQEKNALRLTAEIYEQSGRIPEALAAWKRYYTMKDSLLNDNVLRHQNDLETLYETEKNAKKIAVLTKDKTIKTTLLIGLTVGFVLLLSFLFVLFNRAKLRKRTNEQLEKQNAIIEEKNKDITDSINYARRIQEAVLPSAATLKSQFEDAFIFYRPRDIVSGDFWWFTENEGTFYLAVADCTGHGVPGGFMSVMGAAFLSEVINEKKCTSPEEILDVLRLKVIRALKNTGDDNKSVKDGMDIAMATFGADRLMKFACANNPIWVVRNGQVIEFPADKFPVGLHTEKIEPFTLREFQLQKDDLVYLFTDGFADQFGGIGGKKFKYKQLKELFASISDFPAAQQHVKVAQAFDNWKGELGQVDDVLVIGIKIR